MLFARRQLKNLGLQLFEWAKFDEILVWRAQKLRRVAVLNLHRVSPEANPYWSPMPPRLFAELLRFLTAHFTVTTFGSLASVDDSQRPLAILSFDDGYHDFVEYAAPLLHRYGVPCNQNVIPGSVESGRPPWTVELSEFLNSAPRSVIDRIEVPGFTRRLHGDSADEKMRYGVALSHYLKMRPRQERASLWEGIARLIDEQETPLCRMMSVDDIRALGSEFEIGAHSWSHESMGFEPMAFFTEDLERCVRWFDEVLERPLRVYAFPNGSYRQEQVEYALTRVEHVLLVDEKMGTAHDRVVPRLTMHGSSRAEVRLQAVAYRSLW